MQRGEGPRVHAYSKLNFSIRSHCQKVAAKPNSIMGVIKHTFNNLEKDIFTKLYKSMVRTIIE